MEDCLLTSALLLVACRWISFTAFTGALHFNPQMHAEDVCRRPADEERRRQTYPLMPVMRKMRLPLIFVQLTNLSMLLASTV